MSSSPKKPERKPADLADAADEPAAAATDEKRITLKTADNQLFKVEISVAMEFAAVKAFYEDSEAAAAAYSEENTPIPLLNVSSAPLAVTIEYCRKQVEFGGKSASQEVRDKYNAEFLKTRSKEELKELILVANFLNIRDFLDVLNQAVLN